MTERRGEENERQIDKIIRKPRMTERRIN